MQHVLGKEGLLQFQVNPLEGDNAQIYSIALMIGSRVKDDLTPTWSFTVWQGLSNAGIYALMSICWNDYAGDLSAH